MKNNNFLPTKTFKRVKIACFAFFYAAGFFFKKLSEKFS